MTDPQRIQIELNGAPRELAAGMTIATLVESEGYAPNQVAIELNRELVPRAARDDRHLRAGDRIEIVTLVGGG